MRDYLIPVPVDFQRRLKDPGAWVSVGFCLHLAATTLWPKLSSALRELEAGKPFDSQRHELALMLRGPYAMLAGLAIENFLKGAILQQTTSSQRRVIKTHDLLRLSARASFTWTVSQEDVLKRLTAFVQWAGRYPIALTEQETQATSRILRRADYLEISAIVHSLVQFHQKGLWRS